VTAWRTWLVGGLTLLCLGAALFLPPTPQPIQYHDFADQRVLFGIANFLDVASNVLFLIAGVLGLVSVQRHTAFESPRERWPYAVFFLGVLLTAFGSSYYHLAPDNERLFWDRLPMAIGFTALIATQIVDRISVRSGLMLLAPMLLLGAAVVIYWRATERAGAGNVVPYVILQGYSMVILLFVAALFPSRYTHARLIYAAFAAYVAAKVFEACDRFTFALTGLVSGHTLKHLVAGAATLIVCSMLWLRRPVAARTTSSPAP
jgi:hypothetical protein